MGTKDDIVRIATDYIQRNGVNAFSYADIARKMNIKKPSIHYYFPVKSGLRVKMCVWLGVSRGLDLAFLNAD